MTCLAPAGMILDNIPKWSNNYGPHGPISNLYAVLPADMYYVASTL